MQFLNENSGERKILSLLKIKLVFNRKLLLKVKMQSPQLMRQRNFKNKSRNCRCLKKTSLKKLVLMRSIGEQNNKSHSNNKNQNTKSLKLRNLMHQMMKDKKRNNHHLKNKKKKRNKKQL